MPTFQNNATLTFNGRSVLSNTVTGEINNVLTGTKTAPVSVYRPGDRITYVVNLVNAGNTALTALTVTDDLGAYAFGGGTLIPLTYIDDSVALFVNGTPQAAPAAEVQDGELVVSGITVPSDGNAAIVYVTEVNEYAPLGEGATVVNTASVTGDGVVAPLSLTATITADGTADLSVLKSLSPSSVVGGGQITYTFEISNSGPSPVSATDEVTLTDVLNPVLSDLTVAYNGEILSAGADYTYENGTLTVLAGSITLPAATCAQSETGEWVVTPGVGTLTVTGSV